MSAPGGSSPRARGTRAARLDAQFPRRFIPAGAGNTGLCPKSSPLMTVHPRGCGEHALVVLLVTVTSGSSPRVRGTRAFFNRFCAHQRFIPAGAGNTPALYLRAALVAVHPRGCGEHFQAFLDVDPHVLYSCFQGTRRTKGGHSARECVAGRFVSRSGLCPLFCFIPAGAGNTKSGKVATNSSAVHPRGCGEHQNSEMIACA